MKYPCLITTDIHLTAHPHAEYRWNLFPWVNEQIKAHGVRSVRILGDITDAKDHHSATLVNRVVDNVQAIHCDDVWLMSGNHDWLQRGQEFFRFLNHLPGVRFITRPTEDETVGFHELNIFLPYTKTPAKDWETIDWGHYDYAFMHQTINTARASNGQVMEGEGVPAMDVRRRVYSGDIHVPQTIGNVTYIGSPYHVHFGDNFDPRVLILHSRGKETWLRMPSPKRIVLNASSLRDVRNADLQADDQVKLRMTLEAADKHAWGRIKREAVAMLEDKGVLVHGAELLIAGEKQRWSAAARNKVLDTVTDAERVTRYVESEELGGMALDAALDVLESK